MRTSTTPETAHGRRPAGEPAASSASQGRERETAELLGLLRSPGARGVLLFGPPGVGTSHLARAVARAYRDQAREGDPPLSVRDAADTAAHRPDDVGTPSTGTLLLATARSPRTAERLGLMPYPVGPLPVPADCSALDVARFAAAPGVRLYAQTLTALQPGFRLHAGNLTEVARLCADLRGVPGDLVHAARFAALEGQTALSAALLRRSGPEGTMLALSAATSPYTVPASSIGPSGHRLLTHAAVFAGGCAPEALREVAQVPPAEFPVALRTLWEAQRIAVSDRPSGTLSGVALTRLHLPLAGPVGPEEPPGARIAHARYYARVAAAAARRAEGGVAQAEALGALRAEEDNLRAAAETLLDAGQADEALGLLSDVRVHDHATDPFSAGADQLALLLRGDHRVADPERLRLLLAEARVRDGEPEAAAALLDTPGPESVTRLRLVALVRFHRDRRAGTDALRRATAGPGADHEPATCHALLDLALAELLTGEPESAAAAAHRALLVALRRHDRLSAGAALLRLAVVEAVNGRDPAEYTGRALSHLRPLGGPALVGALAAIAGSHLLPGITVRAAGTARVLGAFHVFRRTAMTAPTAPDLAGCRLERRLRGVLDEPDLLAGLRAGARVCLPGIAGMLAEPYSRCPGSGSTVDGPRAVAGTGTAVLTARQLQVARLVAEGLGNKQVARRLGISEWTVVNHLREIMRRLECTSRVQVAGWIQERTVRDVRPGARHAGAGAGVSC